MQRERPIFFSGPMVSAILAGQKTQTRRTQRLEFYSRPGNDPDGWRCARVDDGAAYMVYKQTPQERAEKCPLGKPGDRLWVREAWRIGAWNEDQGALAIDYCDGPRREWLTIPADDDGSRFARYWIQCSDELEAKGIPARPDGQYRWAPGQSPLRWRPSIHMPRWASRITLEITDVRVEPLHDISPADCVEEGYISPKGTRYAQEELNALDWYRDLWESINGRGSWEANPWVWVVEFRRI